MDVNESLRAIAFLFLCLLLFKDTSGKDELRRIHKELERIANELKRRKQE